MRVTTIVFISLSFFAHSVQSAQNTQSVQKKSSCLEAVLSPSPKDTHPSSHLTTAISVVVPVYRELYNGNIGRLLKQLFEQNIQTLSRKTEMQVVFVVNNTRDASIEVKAENKKTVELLRQNLKSEFPEETGFIESLKQRGVKLIVVDRVYPGLLKRNIGSIRDVGVEEGMKGTPHISLDHHFIANLDADTGIPENYLMRIASNFLENSEVKTILLNRKLRMEPGSEPSLYATTHLLRFLDSYAMFMGKLGLPNDSGNVIPPVDSPQIATRASELKAIGGIQRVDINEDIILMKKLWQRGGVSIDIDLVVRPNDRSRSDGYDAGDRLKNIDDFLQMAAGEINITYSILEDSLAHSLLAVYNVSEILDPVYVTPLFDFFDIPFQEKLWRQSVSKNKDSGQRKLDVKQIEKILMEYLPLVVKNYVQKKKTIRFSQIVVPWFVKNIPEREIESLFKAITSALERDHKETDHIQEALKSLIEKRQTGALRGRSEEFFSGNTWIEGMIVDLRGKGLSDNEIFDKIAESYPDWFLRIDQTLFRSEEVIVSETTSWIQKVKGNPSEFPIANQFFAKLEQFISGSWTLKSH